MKREILKFSAVTAICLLLSIFSFAQRNQKPTPVRDLYVISAKAGGVNLVSGDVAISRIGGSSGYLKKGDSVEVGDKISTGIQGKAEILLNPGSFVRLAENSEFEFLTTDLDDLAVKINRGSAIFEVITSSEFKVAVNAPKSKFYMLKSGVYRIDVLPDGTAKIEVWKGKAQLENGSATIVKGGQTITAGNEQAVAVSKFDRDEKDTFELWSKERAKELAKINAKLLDREMNRSLISSFSQNGWGVFNSFGLWVRDPFSQSYCFLPFGFGWSSPYGYFYNRDIWSYRSAPVYVNNINPNINVGNGQQNTNPSYGGSQPGNGNGGSNFPVSPGMPMNPELSRPIEAPAPARSSPMQRKIDSQRDQ